ncbi:hypothetical protein SERLA73DRAFT_75924 [Serpula lacrymans var. lacrymans S7.3]|uniref:Fungal-type protein kinase domain-containing protein n=1 Tax=Serpula lacrymans var. lacrymans (strain S7.3) TaxID=936435 RepID=F8Q5M9_SERL3|nr:hypothetical protein SERLA73DRAFT_75924 [Serpula lacrymans var. lacrymans S7.3]
MHQELDKAIRWRELDRELEQRRSGTLPFISMRLLNAWDDDEPILHTFADDLESFFWVILCVLLSIGAERNSLTGKERKWLLEILAADDPRMSGLVKGSTLRTFEKSLPDNDFSPVLKVFVPFFTEIMPLLDEGPKVAKGVDSTNLVESLTTLGDRFYEMWFKAFLRALPSLPKTWDEVFITPI